MRSIWAIPADARAMSGEQKRQLAELIELKLRELDARLASEKGFVFLQRQVPPQVAEQVRALKLPGVHQEMEYRRYYPSAEMTAHLVGFT